nr:HlyD family efflux transporter periplasmic adaptor subunit [Pseudaminobacter sp.]
VEGDYVLLAPTEVAQIATVSVRRGDRVMPGKPIVALESGDAKIAVAQAQAGLALAEARHADLKLGKRPEEIAVLEANIRSARAQSGEAERVLKRAEDLMERGIATRAEYDKAATAVELAAAQGAQADANLAVAKLAARPQTINAAEQQVKQAEAQLDQAHWRLSRRMLEAPSPGRIDDVIRNAGDLAGPSAPVISMLPDGAVKLKLFLPEPRFSSIGVGTLLDVRCDGCPAGQTARVSYVSPDPEFTPPVIYSLETRQKLVYLVEARPEGSASALQPGQIVDVSLAANSE